MESCRVRMCVRNGGYAYLASPYTHLEPSTEAYRYEQVRDAFASLVTSDFGKCMAIVSPILMTHNAVVVHGLPRDAGWWERFNLELMKRATVCIVLCVPGWRESVGVSKELKWFKQNNVPILYYEGWELVWCPEGGL
jgi:hypothetical protein